MAFLLQSYKNSGGYGLPLTYNEKNENWHILLCLCRYFDKGFTEMSIEQSSTKYIILVQTSEFDWLSWQPKRLNLQIYIYINIYIYKTTTKKKKKKKNLLRSNQRDKAQTLPKCS